MSNECVNYAFRFFFHLSSRLVSFRRKNELPAKINYTYTVRQPAERRTDNQTKLEHCWNEKWMNHQTKAKWRKIMNNKNVNSFHDEIPPRPEREHPFLRTRSNTNWGHHIEIVLPILRNYKQRPPCLPVLISFVFLIPIVPILWWIPIQSDYGVK